MSHKRSWQKVFLTNRLRRSWQNVFLKKCLLTTYWLFVASAKKTFSSLHGSFISAVTVSVQYSGVKVYKVEQFHPRDSEFVWLQNRLQNSLLTLFAYDIMALSKNILASPSKRLWPIQRSLLGSNRACRCYQSTISKVFVSVRDQCNKMAPILFPGAWAEVKDKTLPSPDGEADWHWFQKYLYRRTSQ